MPTPSGQRRALLLVFVEGNVQITLISVDLQGGGLDFGLHRSLLLFSDRVVPAARPHQYVILTYLMQGKNDAPRDFFMLTPE